MIESDEVGGAAEHVLRYGQQRAVVVESGGGLRSYARGDIDLVAGYPAGAMCPSARGQWLVPWPNRIREGRYVFGDEEHRLPVGDPELATAIHGLVRWLPFQCVGKGDSWASLATVAPARPGYPWTLWVEAHWSLHDSGLTARLRVRNLSDEAAPFAAGAHPYLDLGDAAVDDVALTVPADTILTGDNGMFTQRRLVDSGSDFSSARQVGSSQLGLYTDMSRDSAGLAHTVVERPDGWRIRLWQDEAWPFVLLYTADEVSAEEGRRRSLAVEPMTAAVDAFNSGDGLRVLKPDETFEGTWGISASEAVGSR